MHDYVQMLQKEAELHTDALGNFAVDTVYFGGGTPSLLPLDNMTDIMTALKSCFHIQPNSEITIEVNPESLTFEKAIGYRKMGCNRMSIGVQAMQDHLLQQIGRIHDVDKVHEAVQIARKAGFENLSMDVMMGLPRQMMQDMTQTLQQVCAMEPQHISCYILEVHPDTPMVEDEKLLPNEDDVMEMLDATIRICQEHGYKRYEVSNFAKIGYESRHNLKYWLRQPYLGLGLGAHGFIHERRYQNTTVMQEYLDNLKNGKKCTVDEQVMDAQEQACEELMLRLRLIKGIDLTEFQQKYGVPAIGKKRKLAWIEEGYIDCNGEHLRLTDKGFCVMNALLLPLIQDLRNSLSIKA